MGIPNKIGFYRDGLFRRKVVRHNSAEVDKQLHIKDSGTLYYIPNAVATSFHLPKISSKWLGVEFSFYVEETTAANFRINVINDSRATIRFGYTAAVDSHSTIIPASTEACALRITAVSSVNWLAGGSSHTSTDPSWSACSWSTG